MDSHPILTKTDPHINLGLKHLDNPKNHRKLDFKHQDNLLKLKRLGNLEVKLLGIPMVVVDQDIMVEMELLDIIIIHMQVAVGQGIMVVGLGIEVVVDRMLMD